VSIATSWYDWTVVSPVIGRRDELDAAENLLRLLEGGPAALVLEGPAGIGKTRLWAEMVGRAEACGVVVLTTRPNAADARLVFAGLGDLFRAHGELIAQLPEPQARALAGALRLEPSDDGLDAGALAAGALGTLVSLAASGPVLVAVDDAQWLDPETEGLLAFALRRVGAMPVGLLATVRLAVDEREPRELVAALPDDRVVRRIVGPLTVGALHELVSIEIGSVSRPTLLRLHEASGGNPLYALALARELAVSGHEPQAGEPLAVPSTLERLMEERLGSVDDDVRGTLLSVALLNRPREHVVAAALGDADRPAHDLQLAEDAGLVAIEHDEIRFAHPLLASVLVGSTPERKRRDAHRRLASAAESPEERIHHLALATSPPNAAVASALDDAAAAARARSAPAAAAELADQALALTPPADRRALFDRRLQAGKLHHEAASSVRARELLSAAVACAATGPERAAARLQLALATTHNTETIVLLREAAAETEAESGLRAEILAVLGEMLPDIEGEGSNDSAFANAVALSEDDPDLDRRVRVLCWVAWGRTLGSGTLDSQLLERALELAQGSAEREVVALTTYGALLSHALDIEPARAHLSRVRAMAAGVDDASLAEALEGLGFVEWAAGNWEEAADLTEQSSRLAAQLGAENQECEALGKRALVAACRGEVDAVRAYAERSIELAALTGNVGHHIPGLAMLALSLERYQEAYDWVSPYLERKAKRGPRFPYIKVPMAIEALAHLERTPEALDHLQRFEEEANHSQVPWACASAARCRGILEAAAGNLIEAEALLADAVEGSRSTGMPFELGQSLLVLGTVKRRLRRKLAARETLEEARLVFETLGAPIWSARTETELRRIGGRSATAGVELSEMESQIAVLVRRGQTNDEVAGALQISSKTVEWNLSKIYRKLGVRSRTELAARVTE
jgi:DNA-binding CsgD family transcriptional regulator